MSQIRRPPHTEQATSRKGIRSLRRAAFFGGLSWAIYCLVYFVYFYVVPYIANPADSVILSEQVQMATKLIGIYALLGTIINPIIWIGTTGLVSHLAKSKNSPGGELLHTSSSLSVLVALIPTLLTSGTIGKHNLYLLAIDILLSSILVLGALGRRVMAQVALWLDPLVVSLIMVGIPWLWTKHLTTTPLQKAIIPIILLFGFLSLSALARKFFKLADGPRSVQFLLGSTMVLSVGIALTVTSSVLSNATRWDGTAGPPSTPTFDKGPDVILITMDTVRRADLSVYGYPQPTTPVLQKFARSATVYTKAFATSNMTLPTHASIFTGVYPRRHGAHYLPPSLPYGNPLGEQWDTLAEILRARGYHTAGVVANKSYLDARYGFSQGFDHYDDRSFLELSPARSGLFLQGSISRVLSIALAAQCERLYRSATDINDEVIRSIDYVTTDGRPFFLFINYMDAHEPYVPPPPFNTLFLGLNSSFELHDSFATKQAVMKKIRSISDWEEASLRSQYDGSLAYIDFRIGKVLQYLHQISRFDNAMIIVTSDHGESFGEHYELGHGGTTYQPQIAVPLVIKYPKQHDGYIVDKTTSQVDILPTVLKTVGINTPGEIDGISMVPGSTHGHDWIVSEAYTSPAHHGLAPRFGKEETAIVADDKKLIWSEGNGFEMYDLALDPNEEHNIDGFGSPFAMSLKETLREWRKSGASNTVPDKTHRKERLLDRLRSLGYVQ